jgi:hypothetical protein
MTSVRSTDRKKAATALLATASLIALLAGTPKAAAQDCGGRATPPADLATPSMLYETLSTRTKAQLLAIGFLRKPVAEDCAWIYEVRMLTASGSVVELDFNADGLDLIGARGPENDRDAADLVKTLGGDAAVLTVGTKEDSRGKGSAAGSGQGTGHSGGGDDGGEGGDDGGEGGEGGNSGSGSDNSGSGEGGDGGGEGANSGSGGGGNSGSGGSGEGGEGGGGEGGEGGD